MANLAGGGRRGKHAGTVRLAGWYAGVLLARLAEGGGAEG